jgi:hypothetical protein
MEWEKAMILISMVSFTGPHYHLSSRVARNERATWSQQF